MSRRPIGPSARPSKTERWLNLLAFLLDRHYPSSREEILSQVSDYKEDWVGGDAKSRESIRRRFERDKAELKVERHPERAPHVRINLSALAV